MKRMMLAALLTLAGLNVGFNDLAAQERTLRSLTNKAFRPGEHLSYRIHYGWIDAGYAELFVKKAKSPFPGKESLQLIATGRSNSKYDWIFKVRDRYESYLDETALVPWTFIRNINEGGFTLDQYVTFRQQGNLAQSKKGLFKVPEYTQDILSAFYYARSLDYTGVKPGDLFAVPVFLDDEIINMKFKFTGRETVETDAGKFKCMVFTPIVMKGRVFKEEEDLQIFISDDSNKLPIEARANILIGSIKMTLTDFDGVRNEPKALIEE